MPPEPPIQEAERLAALRAYGVIDTARERDFDELAAYVARVCEAPVAFISLIDERRQWFKAEIGLDAHETPLEASICARVIGSRGFVEIPDTTENPLSRDVAPVEEDRRYRFYASACLLTPEGHAVGTLGVADYHPRTLNEFQRSTLELMARQVMAQLELRRRNRELEQKAREREEDERFLRLVTDRLPVRVGYLDTNYRFRFVNGAYERQFGLPPGSVVGLSPAELAGEAAFEKVRPDLDEALTGHAIVRELEVPYDSGNERVEIRYVPDVDAVGRVRGVVVHVVDVGERFAASEELRKREARTRTLFDALEEGFCVLEMIFDAEGKPSDYRFREFNPAFTRFTGIRAEDALGGRTARELFPSLEESWFETYGRVATTGEPIRFENRAEAMGKWFEVHAFRIGGPGSAEVGLLFQDVTERRRQETALAAERVRRDHTLQTAEVATFEWDAIHDRVYANPLLDEFFGLPADARGRPIGAYFSAIHPDDVERVEATIGASLAVGGRYETEYRVFGNDGRLRSVLARGDAMLDPEGRPSRLSGVVLDVTERVRAEEAVRSTAALLEGVTQGTRELIVSIDKEYRFTTLNEAYREDFRNVFGVEPRVGESLVDLLAHLPDDQESAKAMFGRALAGENVDVTADFGDPGRNRKTFDLRFYPIRNAQGQIIGAGEIARDVTERERMAEELRLEKEKLVKLFRLAPAFIAVVRGPDLTFEYVNDAYYRLVGHRPIVGLPLADAIPESVGGAKGKDYDWLLRDIMAKGEPRTFNERPVLLQKTPGGPIEERFLDLAYQPLEEADGTVSGVLVHGIDVTEGVLARRQIAEREELFRTVFEGASDDAIVVMDLDRKITAWNPAAERITLWPVDEVLGQPADLVFTPDDRRHGKPLVETTEAAWTGKVADERWHLRRDGTRFWGSGTITALHDEVGAVRGYLKVFRDATERYFETQTLAFLSLLTESVIDHRDADAIIESAERMLGEYLGASRVTFAEAAEDGETLTVHQEWAPDLPSLVGDHRPDEFGDELMEEFRAGRTHVSVDAAADARTPSEKEFVAAYRIGSSVTVPVIAKGRLASLVAVHCQTPRAWTEEEVQLVRQVADRMSAEIERARAEAALRRANETLEETVGRRTEELQRAVQEAEGFNYSISHDLRSPLRAMASTASILLEEVGPGLDEEHRDMLVRQSESAKRLGRLIDELLRLSRLARVPVKRETLDMSNKAQRVFEDLEGETNGCRLDVQPGMVAEGDAGLVRTVLQNLIGNACKFSPGGGTVWVGQRGDTFFVRDEGVGFDMQFAAKIFEPFERLVPESQFPGTGIGLANVKRIVERHEGRVWVESEPGKGTTFSFTLGPSGA